MSEVRDNPLEHRFELQIGDGMAVAYYRQEGNVLNFTHTEVPQEWSGQGFGSALLKGALDQVKAHGLKVRATCPFVGAYLARHKEYASLIA